MELRLFWNIIRDRWMIILGPLAAALAAAVAFIAVYPTIYQVTAYIQLQRLGPSPLFLADFPQPLASLLFIDSDKAIGNLELFMKNEALMARVIARCGLDEEVSFPPKKFANPGLTGLMTRKRGVAIEAEKDSEIFSIKGRSVNLEEARTIANVFIEEFYNYYNDRRQDALRQARDRYSAQARNVHRQLERLEEEELAYRTAHDLLDISSQKANLLQASDRIIEYYRIQQAGHKAVLAQTGVELTADHPTVIGLQSQIAVLEELIQKEEAEKIRLLSELLKSELGLKDILRRKQNVEKLYNRLDNGIKLLEAAKDLDFNNFLTISFATIRGEEKDYIYMPRTPVILFLFGLMGLVGGGILAFLVEYEYDALRSYDSFRRFFPRNPALLLTRRSGGSGLAAQLIERGKSDMAILLFRGKPRASAALLRGISSALRRSGHEPFIVSVTGGKETPPAKSASLVLSLSEFHEQKAELADEARARGSGLLLVQFPSLSASSAGLLAGNDHPVIIYGIISGQASVTDVRSDAEYIYSRSWENKLISVFYVR